MGTFSAFGVRFASTFPVPELPADGGEGAGPPPAACALARGDTDEPARRFSGPCDPPLVARTTLGHTERGRDGDLLVTFGGGATFWVSPAADSVVCGVAEDGPGWRRFLLDTVLGSVALARGFEALHAGAVRGPAGVVAVAAGEGGGKSSLVAALVAAGLPLFTDDLLMVAAGGLAHPGPPLMNLPVPVPVPGPGPGPGLVPGQLPAPVQVAAPGPPGWARVLASFGDEVWVAVDRAAVDPSPVAAVVLLERGATAAELSVERLAPNPMALLPLSLQGGSTLERRRARFEACAAVAESAVLLRLAAPLEVPPGDLAAAVVRATTGS